jgi:hypothetical protein
MTVHDPETCRCFECSLLIWDRSCREEEDRELRKKVPTIEITKVKGQGEMPPFLGVCHRHFEKAMPACGVTQATLTAPLEMLEFLIPAALVNAIESVEILYKKGA